MWDTKLWLASPLAFVTARAAVSMPSYTSSAASTEAAATSLIAERFFWGAALGLPRSSLYFVRPSLQEVSSDDQYPSS